MTDYEKDLLNLLNPNEFAMNSEFEFPESQIKTTETGVNTDISMFNAIFSVQYFDNGNELSMNKSVDSQKSKKSMNQKAQHQGVQINEMMCDRIDDDFGTFTFPIVETPDTSKNESSR